jgi:hypothetical protein
MSSENKNTSTSSYNGGIGFLGLLGLIFITLKLLNIITWSWWLVLLPIYGPFVIAMAILIIVFTIVFIGAK